MGDEARIPDVEIKLIEGTFQRLVIGTHETLVMQVPVALEYQQRMKLAEYLRQHFPSMKTLVLDSGITLASVATAEIPSEVLANAETAQES